MACSFCLLDANVLLDLVGLEPVTQRAFALGCTGSP
jgi:hypothetical protein